MKKESRVLLWVQTVQKLKRRKPQVSSLHEKGIKGVVVGPDSSETEKKEAWKGKYNLVFTSPKALFGSHRSSILTMKNKIEAVFDK